MSTSAESTSSFNVVPRTSTVSLSGASVTARYEFWDGGGTKRYDGTEVWVDDVDWVNAGIDATPYYEWEIQLTNVFIDTGSGPVAQASVSWNYVAYLGPLSVSRSTVGTSIYTADYQLRKGDQTETSAIGTLVMTATLT